MMNEQIIRKVKVLKGRAKEGAMKLGLDPDDLVIVTVSLHPLPEYHIEKIEGDPVSYLLEKGMKTRNPERIPVMLKYLEELWRKYPDYRLGQLCWLIAGRDPFHFEMGEFLEFVESKGIEVDWDEVPEYII